MIDISKGRIIASNGYVKLLIPEHPGADSKGYVYEHRAIAEKKIGRSLLAGEQVHHIDGNRQNNNADNLEVLQGRGEHWVRHRKRPDLRLPGEQNTQVACRCGCGLKFDKYDSTGRPRKYISGHNVTHNENTGRFEVRE